MWRARASTRGWVSAGALLTVLTCGTTAASAQVVQSVQLGAGVFFPRGFDTRVPGDTLVADLADANPLFFEISDFVGGTIFGEWNISFGPHVEAGAGIGYYKRTVHSVYRNLVNTDGTEIRQDLRLQRVQQRVALLLVLVRLNGGFRFLFRWSGGSAGGLLLPPDRYGQTAPSRAAVLGVAVT